MSSAEVERDRERVPQFRQHHRLALALEVAGISVQDMADYLDVNRNTVGRWINGHIAPNRGTLRLWALATGVDLGWLETGLPRLDSNQEPTGLQDALVSATLARCEVVDLQEYRSMMITYPATHTPSTTSPRTTQTATVSMLATVMDGGL